jgi:methylated-DNA-[protein]-cysteine S-methyltransferase
MTTTSIIDSPVGPIRLTIDDGVLCGLFFADDGRAPHDATSRPQAFAPVAEQLDAYFAGTLTEFDVPLRLDGTPFQRRVWEVLRSIPYGDTVSYGEIATELGRPSASRAVGAANGSNPIAIVVPCHRVIGSTGRLTGYGGGLPRKRALLDLEHLHRPAGAALLPLR